MARPIAEYRLCPACGLMRLKIVYTKLRGKARLRYFHCRACKAHVRQTNRSDLVVIAPDPAKRKPLSSP